jgi:proline dehydrogenase
MLRSTLLFLSRQRALRRFMETSPAAAPLTRRFVAGQTLTEAIAAATRVEGQGFLVSLDHLGENVSTVEEARASRSAILHALDSIEQARSTSTVSIKLTQFGLDQSEALCRENVEPLAEKARAMGTRVEIDMESSEYTDRTLSLIHSLHARYGCVRAVIQAYLKRSKADIQALNAAGIPVRLCKGAYKESSEAAFQNKTEVDGNYQRLAKLLLDEGVYPAIASHDEQMIDVARPYPKDRFEFQMLYGVRRELQRKLVAEGYRMRLYVPYGDAWYPYFMRRLAERPANVLFVARSMFGN